MTTYALHYTASSSNRNYSFAIDILCTVTASNEEQAITLANTQLEPILTNYDHILDYVIPLTLENTNNG